MSESHEELQDMAPAYVLGVLEPKERVVFEAHLKECADCATEVRSLLGAVDALARSVPQRTPPADLRERVLSSVRGETSASVTRPSRPTNPWWDRRVWLPVAASVLFALGAGIYGSHLHVETRLAALSERADATEREIAVARRAALDARSAVEILAAPDVIRFDLKGEGAATDARARALWTRQHGLVFAGTSMPAPPPGRRYQVWLMSANAVISAGILPEPARGLIVFGTPPDIAQPLGVSVTIEPEGGSARPTGQRVLVGSQPASF